MAADEDLRSLERAAQDGAGGREALTRAMIAAGRGFVLAWCQPDAERLALLGEARVSLRVEVPGGTVEKVGFALGVCDIEDAYALAAAVGRPVVLVRLDDGTGVPAMGCPQTLVRVSVDDWPVRAIHACGSGFMPDDLIPAFGEAGFMVRSEGAGAWRDSEWQRAWESELEDELDQDRRDTERLIEETERFVAELEE